eukprot:916396-Prorocentrum_minimum.AAC.1
MYEATCPHPRNVGECSADADEHSADVWNEHSADVDAHSADVRNEHSADVNEHSADMDARILLVRAWQARGSTGPSRPA